MKTDEQGIVKMLQEKIAEHEGKIASFRQAISALSGTTDEQSTPSMSPAPAKRGRKRGRKRGSKNTPNAAVVAAPAPVKKGKKRGRKPGGTNASSTVASKSSASKSQSSKPVATKPGSKKTRRPRTGQTMEGWVLKQFEDGVPKSNRNLMERYNKETGKKLEMNGFAARIAMIKKKGNVLSAKNGADGVSYSGKKEWFENGKLKDEYSSKIK